MRAPLRRYTKTHTYKFKPPPEDESYGAVFRRLRQELGLTQPAAAEACGISLNTVASWEYKYRQFNTWESSANVRKAIAILKRRLKYQQKGQ